MQYNKVITYLKENNMTDSFDGFFNAVKIVKLNPTKSNPTKEQHKQVLSALLAIARKKAPHEIKLIEKAKMTIKISDLHKLLKLSKAKEVKDFIAYRLAAKLDKKLLAKNNPQPGAIPRDKEEYNLRVKRDAENVFGKEIFPTIDREFIKNSLSKDSIKNSLLNAYDGIMNYITKSNPLLKGKAKDVVSKNISRLIKEGYPQNQAIAISLKQAGIKRKMNPDIKKSRLLEKELETIESLFDSPDDRDNDRQMAAFEKMLDESSPAIKSNPRLYSINETLRKQFEDLIQTYKKIEAEKDTQKSKELLNQLMQIQSIFFNQHQNKIFTVKMFDDLFDLKSKEDIKKLVLKNIIFTFKKPIQAKKYLLTIDSKKIIASKISEFFNNDNTSEISYNKFIEKIYAEYSSKFFGLNQEQGTLYLCILLRNYIHRFPKNPHFELLRSMKKEILNKEIPATSSGQELLIVNEILRDEYDDAVEIIRSSKTYLLNKND